MFYVVGVHQEYVPDSETVNSHYRPTDCHVITAVRRESDAHAVAETCMQLNYVRPEYDDIRVLNQKEVNALLKELSDN